MKPNSPCQCCRESVSEISKRFCKILGFVCPTCFEFTEYADEVMRGATIDGIVLNPKRFTPNTETP